MVSLASVPNGTTMAGQDVRTPVFGKRVERALRSLVKKYEELDERLALGMLAM